MTHVIRIVIPGGGYLGVHLAMSFIALTIVIRIIRWVLDVLP